MRKLLLPLLLFGAVFNAKAQYSEQLFAAIDAPKNFMGCAPYHDKTTRAERAENVAAENKALLRLVNMSYYVQALINCDAAGGKIDYRVLRSTNPESGWELVAEVAALDAHGPVAVNDDNPATGAMIYKLEAREEGEDWKAIDQRILQRPAGVVMEDLDFMTAPFGSLILPQTMLPSSEYTVEIFDLQGGHIESSYVRYGHKLKVHTAHLPFGIYQVIVTGERSRTAKYFLSTGN